MAQGLKPPDPLARRHELAEGVAAARALKTANAYLAEGRALDAIAYLLLAQRDGLQEAEARLAALSEEAVQSGDLFLLRELGLARGEPTRGKTWRALAEAAQAAGLERYAEEARRLAQRDEA